MRCGGSTPLRLEVFFSPVFPGFELGRLNHLLLFLNLYDQIDDIMKCPIRLKLNYMCNCRLETIHESCYRILGRFVKIAFQRKLLKFFHIFFYGKLMLMKTV
ncbi:hypothetical protein KFK09_010871 [Dendrobium nobile]|uniref:Uncharacterized protein n=1 Tax=Dendrobium nobile TaxID=94219 RepID=A0A8T3BDC8_DENNO|nr:hypothetical protein KFK09_010871 [Dendrobium nobile]